jgi:hypothetical protein
LTEGAGAYVSVALTSLTSPYTPHALALLPARRERPRGGRAAEQRDERAAFSLDHLVGERNQQTTYRTGRAFDHVFRTDEQSERISMPSFAVLQTNARADPLF